MKISELYTFEDATMAMAAPTTIVRDTAEEDEQLKIQILDNCRDALAIMKQTKKTLYRGMSGRRLIAFTAIPRSDRQPTTSDPKVQEMMDDILRAGGINALRSNSIFCSGDIQQAKVYGHVYVVFPYDGFEFSWSEVVHDLYDTKVYKQLLTAKTINPEKFLARYGYRGDGFDEALKSGNEILIHGKYVAVPLARNFKVINDLLP